MKNKTLYFQVPTKNITSLYFHPSRDKLLVSSKTSGLLMYQIGTDNRPFLFSAPRFSPVRGILVPNSVGDNKLVKIVGASFEGKVGLWQEHSEKPVIIQQGHTAPINDVDVFVHTGHFMTASNDKVIKLWDPNCKFVTSFTGHNSQVIACAFDQNSPMAISGDQSGSVLIWDYSNPEQVIAVKTSKYPIVSVDIDSTGQCFSLLTARGHLGVFDIRNPERVISSPFKAMPNMAKMHPSKPYLLCTGSTNSQMVYNTETNNLMFSFEGHKTPITCCAWSHNGKTFATADSDGMVIIWNLPKPPKVPKITNFSQWDVHLTQKIPDISSPVRFEILAEQINILAEHIDEYNQKLQDEESRIQQLVNDYRWRI